MPERQKNHLQTYFLSLASCQKTFQLIFTKEQLSWKHLEIAYCSMNLITVPWVVTTRPCPVTYPWVETTRPYLF
jgi:hypothetical protein